jgi:transcriptional regulator with XRE-family HTH domain
LVRTKQRGVPTLGERVTSLMEALNLNASELSARTGISVSYLTRIIQGEVVNPTIDFVMRIADGLGVTESELLRPAEEAGRGRPSVGQPIQAGSAPSPKQPPLSQSDLDVLAATGTFGSPSSLKDDQEQQLPTFEEQARQIITSYHLPYAKQMIAQQMSLGAIRIICWGLKEADE